MYLVFCECEKVARNCLYRADSKKVAGYQKVINAAFWRHQWPLAVEKKMSGNSFERAEGRSFVTFRHISSLFVTWDGSPERQVEPTLRGGGRGFAAYPCRLKRIRRTALRAFLAEA
jgi:hypothetical protein